MKMFERASIEESLALGEELRALKNKRTAKVNRKHIYKLRRGFMSSYDRGTLEYIRGNMLAEGCSHARKIEL